MHQGQKSLDRPRRLGSARSKGSVLANVLYCCSGHGAVRKARSAINSLEHPASSPKRRPLKLTVNWRAPICKSATGIPAIPNNGAPICNRHSGSSAFGGRSKAAATSRVLSRRLYRKRYHTPKAECNSALHQCPSKRFALPLLKGEGPNHPIELGVGKPGKNRPKQGDLAVLQPSCIHNHEVDARLFETVQD
jgi:hypothetical protein